ncbi:hypothetical protein [Aliiglaciecola sp. M165]|uniref:hypothetical protein n=1 Tax=Aliiglaciecola sp. M165 TaxID=2593649 RepID=UPI00117DBAEB|nr:hypothetical protein [Aliiglaciecola sp. M165]TRY29773.1 hypothetical protein FM019_16510 [Aliiglaciecola sp. M165]
MKLSLTKPLSILTFTTTLLLLGGCATSAKIEQTTLNMQFYALSGKSLTVNYAHEAINRDVLPEDGYAKTQFKSLSGFTQKVLNKGKVSVTRQTQSAQYTLDVKFEHPNELGAVFYDHQLASSMAKSLLTLGLNGSSDYKIVANYKVTFTLQTSDGNPVATQSYVVEDAFDHQRSKFGFGSFDKMRELNAQLLEKTYTEKLIRFLNLANQSIAVKG